MESQKIKKLWSKFRESKNHIHLKPASLIASKDSTALFNLAGMQQLIPYLTGKTHPDGDRLYNIQGCIRTNDIQEVGDKTHLTYFEMMGNWSLGSYFKKDSIEYSYEFLVDHLNIDPKKLAVTVFEGDENVPKDTQSAKIWESVGIPPHKISYLDRSENWWEPGSIGPCGPDTEIFYRVGPDKYPSKDNNVGVNEDNWIEIWNNVFMEYYNDGSRNLEKLDNQNVDTGMGFERIAKVLQGVDSVYETDIFTKLIDLVQDYTGVKYDTKPKVIRIIADHLRTSGFLINAGVIPSNTDRGYVLRRLIRRMYYNIYKLKDGSIDLDKLDKLTYKCLEHTSKKHNVDFDIDMIVESIHKECKQFQKTIDRGLDMLDDILKDKDGKQLTGKQVFKLYDTYGFPSQLTKQIATDRGYDVDMEGYQKQMEKARKRSRQGEMDKFSQGVDWSRYVQDIQPTKFVGYDTMSLEDVELIKEFELEDKKVLVFDKTPFYAESGGQTGDTGTIKIQDRTYQIVDVQKYGGVVLHIAKNS